MREAFLDNRNAKRAEILRCVKNSINTLAYGELGVGKTTLIKAIVEEINRECGQAIYIDCSLYQTANAILREILISLGNVIASRSNYDLIKRLKEKTRKLKIFILLDHFENLKRHDILNILSGLDFWVCLVADSFESRRTMDFTNRARFANMIKIERLSDNQVFEILREEANTRTRDKTIQEIVEKSCGNLTFALNTLRSIEAANGKNVSIEQIDLCDKTQKYDEDHSTILEILRHQNRIPSGELYNIYCEKLEYPKSERSFRNFMQALCRQGLVKSIGDKRGRSYQIVESQVVSNE